MDKNSLAKLSRQLPKEGYLIITNARAGASTGHESLPHDLATIDAKHRLDELSHLSNRKKKFESIHHVSL
jgi:hypothetical protein